MSEFAKELKAYAEHLPEEHEAHVRQGKALEAMLDKAKSQTLTPAERDTLLTHPGSDTAPAASIADETWAEESTPEPEQAKTADKKEKGRLQTGAWASFGKTDVTPAQEAMLTGEPLLRQVSRRVGGQFWFTVKVYPSAILLERQVRKVNQTTLQPYWDLQSKSEPLFERSLLPVQRVVVLANSTPSEEEKASPNNSIKIVWEGQGDGMTSPQTAPISPSFDPHELGGLVAAGKNFLPPAQKLGGGDLRKALGMLINFNGDTLMYNPGEDANGKTPPNRDELIARQHALIPTVYRFGNPGWSCLDRYAAKEGRGSPEWTHVHPNHELYAGDTSTGYVKKGGDEKIWREMMEDLLRRRPLIGVYLAMVLGSFSRDLADDAGNSVANQVSPCVIVAGDPGYGKSAIFRVCFSAFTNAHATPVWMSKATDAAINNIAHGANNACIMIDELQIQATKSNFLEMMMGILNGDGNTKTQNGGTQLADARRYATTVFGTSNQFIEVLAELGRRVGKERFNEALGQRTIDLDAATWSPFERHPDNSPEYATTEREILGLMSITSSNYGHLYEPTVNYYNQNRSEVVRKQRADIENYVGILNGVPAASRQSAFFGYTQTGIDALPHLLNVSPETLAVIQKNWDAMVQSIRDRKEIKKEAQKDLLEDLLAHINGRLDRVGVRGQRKSDTAYWWPPGATSANDKTQINAALEQCDLVAKKGGAFYEYIQGSLLQSPDDEPDEIWVSASGVKDLQQNAQINIKELAEKAARHDPPFLVGYTVSKNTDQTKERSTWAFATLQKQVLNHGRYYCFSLSAYRQFQAARAAAEAAAVAAEAALAQRLRLAAMTEEEFWDESLGPDTRVEKPAVAVAQPALKKTNTLPGSGVRAAYDARDAMLAGVGLTGKEAEAHLRSFDKDREKDQ